MKPFTVADDRNDPVTITAKTANEAAKAFFDDHKPEGIFLVTDIRGNKCGFEVSGKAFRQLPARQAAALRFKKKKN